MNGLKKYFLALVFCAALAIIQALGGPVYAQNSAVEQIDEKSIRAAMESVSGATDIDNQVKAEIVEFYNQTLEQLKIASDWESKAQGYSNELKNAPKTLKALREQARSLSEQGLPTIAESDTVESMEQVLIENEVELSTLKQQSADIDLTLKNSAKSRLDTINELGKAKKKLAEIQQRGDQSPDIPGEQRRRKAKRAFSVAQEKTLVSQVKAYETLLRGFDIRMDVARAQNDLAEVTIELREKRVEALRRRIKDRKRIEAVEAARNALELSTEVLTGVPALRVLAEENVDLTARRTSPDSPLARTEQARKSLDETETKLAAVTAGLADVEKRLESSTMSSNAGLTLRMERKKLLGIYQHRTAVELRRGEIARVQTARIELDDQRAAMRKQEAGIRTQIDSLSESISEDQKRRIESAFADLAKAKRDNLDELISGYNHYYNALIDLDNSETQLITQMEKFRKLIDERILWTKSGPSLGASELAGTAKAAAWLFSPANWGNTAVVVYGNAGTKPGSTALGLLFLLALFFSAIRLKARQRQNALSAEAHEHYSFPPTLESFGIAAIYAARLPFLLWFVSTRMLPSSNVADFSGPVANGLAVTAVCLFSIDLFRRIAMPGGLGCSHFAWNEQVCEVISNRLLKLMLWALPLCFVVVTIENQMSDAFKDSLGRMSFILLMLLLGLFFKNLLRPSSGILTNILGIDIGKRKGVARVVHAAPSLIPPALAILAALGYYMTALHLAWRFLLTLWLLMGFLVIRGLLLRWLFLVSLKEADLDEIERKGMESPDHKPMPISESKKATLKTDPVAGSEISLQSLKLLRIATIATAAVALWFIWIDVVPALKILSRIELWSTFNKITQVVSLGDGNSSKQIFETVTPITLGDLATALIIFSLAIMVSKNLPALLRLTLLKWLPFDEGAKYAIKAVTGYVVVIVGIILFFGAIGVGWAKVQWLAAAVTVGLGFGLQDIFANFVSGLIILAERPIRIGDTVTVGGIEGTVMQIRIRATTIEAWDKRELVIPNKEFITGQLINWTLSNEIMRVVVTVGIAYGSDAEKAIRLLKDITEKNPAILKEPPTKIIFKEFGDSALVLEVRAFVNGLPNYLPTLTALNLEIHRTFKEENLEISFPQRDLHIRSISVPVPVKVEREDI